jgi:hypothetical protein
MNSIEAVKLAFEGKKIRRKKWYFESKDRCVHLFALRGMSGELSDHVLKTAYCRMCYCSTAYCSSDGKTEHSTFLPEDVLANDWEVIDE